MEVQTEKERLQERAYWLAVENDISSRVVFNVINAETGGTWDCSKIGKSGEIGCLQIIPKFHPNVDPTNFEESVRYFISEYKEGRDWQWTGCSCVKTLRARGIKLPPYGVDARDFLPNSNLTDGKVVILKYGKDSHVAEKIKIKNEGLLVFEGNKEPCKMGYRLIPWKELETTLVGFYNPTPASSNLSSGG